MIGDGGPRAPEIVAVVGQTSMHVEIALHMEAMSVLELALDFVLLPKAAAVIQIALKNVTLFNREQVERNRLGGSLGGGNGCLVIHLRSRPAERSEGDGAAGNEREKILHRIGLS